MSSSTIWLFVLGLLFFAEVGPASACSCIQSTPRQHARDADVIFTGLATDRDVRDEPDPYLEDEGFEVPTQVVRFDVETVYKGTLAPKVTVRSALDSAACGFGFSPRRRYTVFAHEKSGMYLASLCSATTTGTIEPATFGLLSSEEPAGPSSPDQGDPSSFPWIPALAVGGGLLLLAVLLAARRRRSA